MRKDIQLYCLGCEVCSRTKGDLRRRAPMGNTKVPSCPFEFVSLDLIGPFPLSSKKNKYILVTQCIFSSFIVISPIPDKSAEAVAEGYVRDVFSRFGGSKMVLSDNGREFKNTLFLGINKLLRQNNVFTLPYRPQANGKNERSHKSLLTSIKSYVLEKKGECWEQYLPLLELASNSQEKVSHGYSPFFLVHNFDAKLPIESLLSLPLQTKDPQLNTIAVRDWQASKVNECRRLREFVRDLVILEQEKRKADYMKKISKFGYNVGDVVWLFHSRTFNDEDREFDNSSRKLLVKWHGPFRITSKKGVSYTLDISGNSKYKNSRLDGRVHQDRLKLAHSPFEFVHASDPDESKINDLFDSSFLPEDSFLPVEPEEEFEVEAIKEHRIIGVFDSLNEDNNSYEYKVRWKDYDPTFDLWLKQEDLDNCEDILKDYLQSDLHQHFQQEIVARSRVAGEDV